MIFIAWVLCFAASAWASGLELPIFKNAFTKSCAYVHTADSWSESIFASGSSKLHFSPPNDEFVSLTMRFRPNTTEPSHKDFELHAVIMNADDMMKVEFGEYLVYENCDEAAYQKKLCHQEDDAGSDFNLFKLIETKNVTSSFESFTYNTSSDFEYNFEESGMYCFVLYPDSLSSSDKGYHGGPLTHVHTNWQSSFGELSLLDFKRLLLSFYLTCAYGIYSLIYAGMVAKRVSNCSSSPVKSYRKMRYMFQYKVLSFLAGAFFIHLIAFINYSFMNRFERYSVPTPIVIIFGTFELISSTVFTFWIIYNLMLFSAGAWVGSLKKSSNKVLISRVTCVALFFETVLHHIQRNSVSQLFHSYGRDHVNEKVSVKFIIIGAVCFCWSFYTTYKIQDKQTKKLYIKSVLLLGVMFLGSVILHFVFKSYKMEYLTKVIQLVTMIVFSLLWKDITFQKGVLCLE